MPRLIFLHLSLSRHEFKRIYVYLYNLMLSGPNIAHWPRNSTRKNEIRLFILLKYILRVCFKKFTELTPKVLQTARSFFAINYCETKLI